MMMSATDADDGDETRQPGHDERGHHDDVDDYELDRRTCTAMDTSTWGVLSRAAGQADSDSARHKYTVPV